MQTREFKLDKFKLGNTKNEWGGTASHSKTVTCDLVVRQQQSLTRRWYKMADLTLLISWTVHNALLSNCGLVGMSVVSTSLENTEAVESYKGDKRATVMRQGSKAILGLLHTQRNELIDLFFEKFMLLQSHPYILTTRVNRRALQVDHWQNSRASVRADRVHDSYKNYLRGVSTESIMERLHTKSYGGVVSYLPAFINGNYTNPGNVSLCQVVMWAPPRIMVFPEFASVHGEGLKKDARRTIHKKYSRVGSSAPVRDYIDSKLMAVDGGGSLKELTCVELNEV